MLQKTTIPAIPADSVTACCSATYVKGSLGKASIMNFKELPEGIVSHYFSFFRAKSNIVNQNVLVFRRKVFF
jgi:hypothetical protein